MYSQNNEDEIIGNYFKDRTGTFLDIGSNDGETLSNVRLLALKGWSGVCIEPCLIPFNKLSTLYKENKVIDLYNCAIGLESGKSYIYESGEHLGKGDSGLLSTLIPTEMDRWGDTESFSKVPVEVCSWYDFYGILNERYEPFTCEFISIDCEGLDVDILEQMDLDAMETEMVCIEHNSNKEALRRIKKKLKGWTVVGKNHENIIYVR